ncbi:nucleoside diphosphate kinase [Folsomia candida]|uniref:nucleoside-diphosphate kinase n=1 Tax=Folsomia candida TaxID=158441 RepID=A0A226DKR1_FOLCA|nr:nucleoside diphosphate kinase [Folsomia candida]XP_021961296.1 nucleoside diphosphate kinase [Folsomia candida]OXA45813.1 Nucleoside diphosphate kinase [Folsomia candida]
MEETLLLSKGRCRIDGFEIDKAQVERTFIMIKPDGVQRGLIGKVINRFEKKGLKLKAMKFMMPTPELIKEMYKDEKHEPYFDKLLYIMTCGPAVPMIWEGVDAVGVGRRTISELITENSLPGSIRGDTSIHVGRNVCHGADNQQEADMDIALFFGDLLETMSKSV